MFLVLSYLGQSAHALGIDANAGPGTYVWVGNHRLHIHCIGKGSPTVIFDSGLGGTALVWARVQPRVAVFTTCIAGNAYAQNEMDHVDLKSASKIGIV